MDFESKRLVHTMSRSRVDEDGNRVMVYAGTYKGSSGGMEGEGVLQTRDATGRAQGLLRGQGLVDDAHADAPTMGIMSLVVPMPW